MAQGWSRQERLSRILVGTIWLGCADATRNETTPVTRTLLHQYCARTYCRWPYWKVIRGFEAFLAP